MANTPNIEQQQIIQSPTDKPLIITAGAGTGKTTTLTARFVYLLEKYELNPDNILLLTFTNKASDEMKERVIAQTGFSVSEKENLWIHTFHSFCARVLKEESVFLNIPSDFEPIDTIEQKIIYRQVLNMMMELKGGFSEIKDELSYFELSDYKSFFDDSFYIIEKLRDNIISPARFKDIISSDKLVLGRSYALSKIISVLYSEFDSLMAEMEVKDFSKLIMDVIEILSKNPEIRQKYLQKFRFVMVDEFQDTNHAQFELLKLICDDKMSNVTIVGDQFQSIYQWRGADPENMNWFTRGADNIEVKYLTKNYRSYGEILSLADNFLLVRYSGTNKLTAEKGNLSSPAIFCYQDDKNEPDFIAHEIRRILDGGSYKPDDIVILLRNIKNKAMPYEKALSSVGVSFYTSSSGSFFEKDEIKDLSAYLRLIDDPFNKEALVRVLLRPPYSIPEPDLYAIQKQSELEDKRLFEAIKETSPELSVLYDMVINLCAMKDKLNPLELYYAFCRMSSFDKFIFDSPALYPNKRENLNKFLGILQKFCSRNGSFGFADFVSYFQMAASEAEDDVELEKIQAQNCVKIMTLHKAKGLEFPVVFLSGLDVFNEKKRGSKHSSFYLGKNNKLAIKGCDEYEVIKNEKAKNELDELFRLYYVGITRAKEKLYLTGKKLDTFMEALANCDKNSWAELSKLPDLGENKDAGFDESDFWGKINLIKQNIEHKMHDEVKPDNKIITLSCSTIEEYEECPYKYYLKNILRVSNNNLGGGAAEPEIRWDKIGTVIHESIDEFHRGERVFDIMEIASKKQAQAGLSGESLKYINEALEFYSKTDFFRQESGEFFAEYPFTLRYPFFELRGQIDRLSLNNGLCHIIDFKTGFKGDRGKYKFQMELYAIACSKLFGVNDITVSLLFLNQGRVDNFKVTHEDLKTAEEKLIKIAGEFKDNGFNRNSNYHCKYCLYNVLHECCNVLSKNFLLSAESYYKHFYELIGFEENTSLKTQEDGGVIAIRFKNSDVSDDYGYFVEFFAETYFLKTRKGDFVKLIGQGIKGETAQVIDITKTSVVFYAARSRDWRKYSHFAEYKDKLSFSRMKENLITFYLNEHPLKDVILQKRQPEQINILPFDVSGIDGLDEFQFTAVQSALVFTDLLIVNGPPGTGKTLTIAHMVNELMKQRKRVLISTYTNRALDAILVKLIALIEKENAGRLSDIIRIGREAMVHNRIKELGLVIGDGSPSSRICVKVKDKLVVGITAAGIRNDLFEEMFDVGVIDEASQMPEPFSIGVANHSKKLVMIGDNNQLPPVIQDDRAIAGGLNISLFERMNGFLEKQNSGCCLMLKKQYRMNKKLMDFSSSFFYNGEVSAGNMETASKKYHITSKEISVRSKWIDPILNPDEALVFVNLACCGSGGILLGSECIYNIIMDGFVKNGCDLSGIGIISPYRAEVGFLRKQINLDGLEIDTIDRFQGSDKEVIILSCAIEDGKLPLLLVNKNRFNVAVTRAKSKLILVGKFPDKYNDDNYFYKFIDYIKETGLIIDYTKI